MQKGVLHSKTESNSKHKKLMNSLQTNLLFLKYAFNLIKNNDFQEWLEGLIPEHAELYTHFHNKLNAIDTTPLFIQSLEKASCENLIHLEDFFNNPAHNAIKLFFLENKVVLEAFDFNFKTFILNKNLPKENASKTEVRTGMNNGAGKQFPEPAVPYCQLYPTMIERSKHNSPYCKESSDAKNKTCRLN